MEGRGGFEVEGEASDRRPIHPNPTVTVADTAFRIMYIMLNAGRYYLGLLKLVSVFLIDVLLFLDSAPY